MNKLFTFTVAACGAVSLIARTSEVFHVYRKIGAGDNVIYSPVMNGAAKAELSSENPVIKVLVQGEYSVMSAEGYMCPANVAGFFTYVEDTCAGAGVADGVVTGMTYTAGVLTLQRSNGLPPLSILIPSGVMPVVQQDGSYLFHNGVDADVLIPAAFMPSNPASLTALMNAIKASSYADIVNNAFGVPQHITIIIPL